MSGGTLIGKTRYTVRLPARSTNNLMITLAARDLQEFRQRGMDLFRAGGASRSQVGQCKDDVLGVERKFGEGTKTVPEPSAGNELWSPMCLYRRTLTFLR